MDAKARTDFVNKNYSATSAPADTPWTIPPRATPTTPESCRTPTTIVSAATTVTAYTIATTPPISLIISSLSATRPLAVHHSGRRHRWAIVMNPSVLPPQNSPPPLPKPSTFLPPNPGTSSSSVLVLGHTPLLVPPTVSAKFHDAPLVPARATGGRAAKPGNRECVVLVLGLAIPTVVWACDNGLGAALGQRRRVHRRAAHAPRSGPCGRLTRSPGDGRAGGTSAPRRLSGALGKASLRGEIYGISAERSGGGMWCR